MAKTGSGGVAGPGRRKGEVVGWEEGLTDADKANLLEIRDHTDEVIDALGTAIVRGLEAIGIEAESDAAAICPVDTGRLRNSITHTLDGKHAYIGTNVEYARYVHEGVHGRNGQPFLTDAVNHNLSKYQSIFSDALRNA